MRKHSHHASQHPPVCLTCGCSHTTFGSSKSSSCGTPKLTSGRISSFQGRAVPLRLPRPPEYRERETRSRCGACSRAYTARSIIYAHRFRENGVASGCAADVFYRAPKEGALCQRHWHGAWLMPSQRAVAGAQHGAPRQLAQPQFAVRSVSRNDGSPDCPFGLHASLNVVR